MEAVRLVIHQTTVSEREGRGRKSYGRLPVVRLLVYAQLKGIYRDKTLSKHLRKNPKIAKDLRLKGIFKVHVSVDQLGLPRKIRVTPGNRHDSPFLPELIAGGDARFVLADAGYNSKCCVAQSTSSL